LAATTFAVGEAPLSAGPPFGYFREHFGSLGTSATATLPTGFKVTGDAAPTWTSGTNTTATTAAAGSTGVGAVTNASTGGTYNWCNGVTGTANLDRALGFLNTGGFASPRTILLGLSNTTGETITSLTINWRYEKYRSGSRAWGWTFFGSTDGSTWTAQTAGDRAFAADANNNVISNPPLQWAHSVTINNLNIPNGGVYYLRWTLTGVGGSTNGQALSIDNLEITSGNYLAIDDATNATYATDWINGSNGGSGWGGAWTLSPNPDTGNGGFFMGTSAGNGGGTDSNNDADINTPGTGVAPINALGFYNNAGVVTEAIRDFGLPLKVGDQFRVRLDTGSVAGGGTVGFGLRNAAGQNLVEVFFVGGETLYRLNDASGSNSITGFNYSDQGLEVVFTLTSATTFQFQFQRLSVAGTTHTVTGTLMTPGSGTQEITRMRFFNALAGAGGAANAYINTPQVLDPLPPKVSSINRQTPVATLTNSQTVVYRVTFNEPMATGTLSSADFSPSVVSGSLAGASVTGVNPFGTTAYDVTVDTGTGDGVLRLDVLNSATLYDIAGNRLGDSFTTGQTFQIDKTAPAASSIVRNNPIGALTNAASVVYRITFNEDVGATVQAGDLSLTTVSGTLNAISITNVQSMGSFQYDVTVDAGPSGPSGNDGVLRLDIPGGTAITDGAGNTYTGASFTAGEEYDIDRNEPAISSINRQSPAGSLTNAALLVYRITFDEDMTTATVGTSDFSTSVVSGSLTGHGVLSVSPVSNATYDVNVDPGLGDGFLRLDFVGTGADDLAGNPLGSGFATGQTYHVDRVQPIVTGSNRLTPSGSLTNAGSVVYRVTFSEDLNPLTVTMGDFAVTQVGGTLSGFGVSSITQLDNQNWDVTVSTGPTGQGTLRLDVSPVASIQDVVGNVLSGGFLTGQTYSVDHIAPTVSSITPVNGTTIDIAFSEAMIPAGANTAANYTVSGVGQGTVSANPATATFLSGNSWRLVWGSGSMVNGSLVTVTVAPSVLDSATNPIVPGAGDAASASALPVELSAFSLE